MQEGKPSHTAWGAAMLRAAHQLADQPVVLDDPVVGRVLEREDAARYRAELPRFASREMRGLRAAIAMRSRYAEDRCAEAFARGVRQCVVLGAGLDTFAYRNPHGDALAVVEVDHPATQAWKRARLEQAGVAIPPSVRFVPCDFEQQALGDALAVGGLRRHERTLFTWLGVTVYLTRDAVFSTLRTVASSMPPGSEIVFTYVESPSLLAEHAQQEGEPWKTYISRAELPRELATLGFAASEDFGPDDANRRYFAGRSDGLAIGGLVRIMSARV